MIYNITATSNQKYKYIKSLLQKKSRQKNNEFTVEGIKSVRDAVNAKWPISMIAVSDEFYETENFAYPENTVIYKMPSSIFSGICDTDSPQGIMAVLKMKNTDCFSPSDGQVYIYCDTVTDPGNLGTIIRSADAAGIAGVLLSEKCVDIYSPKTIRATMGSFFHIDIFEKISYEILYSLKKKNYRIISGALTDNSVKHTDCDMTGSVIIVVGNEANGVSDTVLNLSDSCVKIPILGKAESLNVSIAASILMYEAVRQRT